jgi:hypothetical protein
MKFNCKLETYLFKNYIPYTLYTVSYISYFTAYFKHHVDNINTTTVLVFMPNTN